MIFSEQRRYPRYRIPSALIPTAPFLEAHVVWPNHETSLILNLSWKGAAVLRAGLFVPNTSEPLSLGLSFGGEKAHAVRVRVVRVTQDLVAVEFLSLEPEAHLALQEFLRAQEWGVQLRPVQRRFFGPSETADFWFTGPHDVNVFVWLSGQRSVTRVQVRRADVVTEFRRGESWRKLANAGEVQRAIRILSQLQSEDVNMAEFLQSLKGEA